MRKLLFNLHLYGALTVGVFVIILGLTGSIMVFEEGWDRVLNPSLYKVMPEGQEMPVSGLLQAAARAYPDQKISSMRPPQRDNDPATFGVRGPRQVFMNPYTGAILGERNPRTILSRVHQLHTNLLVGPSGKTVVAVVTGVLLFLVISGIFLWWPQKRLTIKWKAPSAWRLHFDIHNAVGIYSSLFLLALGITGLAVHFDNDIEAHIHKARGTVKIGKGRSVGRPKERKADDPDQAVQAALNELPGTKLLSIALPANAKASYLVAVRYPEDLTPGGRSWANVDQYSGKVVGLQNSRTAAAGTRTIILNRAIHTGDIFGMTSKIVMCIACWMLITQAITGYFMWWKKLRATQQGKTRKELAEA